VKTKTSKRKRTWVDKRCKVAKKGGNKKKNGSKVCDYTVLLFSFTVFNGNMFSFFCSKEQEIAKKRGKKKKEAAVQDTIAVQNTATV
jgi:hypothetical protein